MKDKNFYSKGTYVVLLSTCNGRMDCWSGGGTPMLVNFVHKLREDSNTYCFKTENNGWDNNPNNINSQLLLRKATQQEILDYDAAGKSVPARYTLEEGLTMKEFEAGVVIKVLNISHGKEVVNYFSSLGINTSGYSGTQNEKDGDDLIYYGVIKGAFINVTLDYVRANNIKIIELPKEKQMEKQKLTRSQVREIHDIACADWKKIIDNHIALQPFNDEIEFGNKMVSEMFKAATKNQLPVLQRLFVNVDSIFNEQKIYVYRGHAEIYKLHRVASGRYAWISLEGTGHWANGDFASGQEALNSIREFTVLSSIRELADYIKNQL